MSCSPSSLIPFLPHAMKGRGWAGGWFRTFSGPLRRKSLSSSLIGPSPSRRLPTIPQDVQRAELYPPSSSGIAGHLLSATVGVPRAGSSWDCAKLSIDLPGGGFCAGASIASMLQIVVGHLRRTYSILFRALDQLMCSVPVQGWRLCGRLQSTRLTRLQPHHGSNPSAGSAHVWDNTASNSDRVERQDRAGHSR